jgi:Flp pilus assembly protein TadD
MKFRSCICCALPTIALITPILFGQTPVEREPREFGITSFKAPNLPAPKGDSSLVGDLVDSTARVNIPAVEPGPAPIKSAQSYYRAAATSIDRGHFKDAITSLEVAAQLAPDSSSVQAELAYAYYRLGEYENSIKAYQRALSLGASFATRRSLAIAYITAEKPEQAILALLEATQLEPQNAVNHYLLGVAYDRAEQLQEAADHYLRSLTLDGNQPRAYFGLATIYGEQSRTRDAIGLLTKAIQLKPDFVDAYTALGNALSSIRNYKDAIHNYEKAIELDPQNMIARNNLGVAYMGAGKNKEGLAALKSAVAVDPQVGQIHVNLVRVYLHLRDRNGALAEYGVLKTIDSALANMVFAEIYQQHILKVRE